MRKSLLYISLLLFLSSFYGCSLLHRFEIKNTTDKVWKIEYEINDPRGIFKREVTIKNCDTKDEKYLDFDGNSISFYLNPNETSYLVYASNTSYNIYRNYRTYDESKQFQDFLNVNTISISSEQDSFELDVFKLDEILVKNTNRFARIDIARTLEYFEIKIP